MNLGQAVAVCLYELVRGQKLAPTKTDLVKKEKIAGSGEVERLTQVLLNVLQASGYIKPRAVAADEKLRRLVRRMELNASDADVLLGMIRQIAWKMRTNEKNKA